MLRLPAVSGRFYPSDPGELTSLVEEFAPRDPLHPPQTAKACLVPHAGYVYSGHVAGAVFARIVFPKRILVLGVRHQPRGEPAAILSSGAWRTPLGDAPIDSELAARCKAACPLLKEDALAHRDEHSLEVQIPFLQVLAKEFTFVPIALGMIRLETLVAVGEAIGNVLKESREEILLVTTTDLNHYEDDATTRVKDRKAVEQLLEMNPRGLYDVCRNEEISMCGLGPSVAMLTALRVLGGASSELVRYATSADVSGDQSHVVGYAGILYR